MLLVIFDRNNRINIYIVNYLLTLLIEEVFGSYKSLYQL